MSEFFLGRRLEGKNLATLRIHTAHHVLDGAILARRVHRLKNQQQPPAILRVELVLQLCKLQGGVLQQLFRFILEFPRKPARILRIKVTQAKLSAMVDSVESGQRPQFLLLFHAAGLLGCPSCPGISEAGIIRITLQDCITAAWPGKKQAPAA